jgi:hypothetical protein
MCVHACACVFARVRVRSSLHDLLQERDGYWKWMAANVASGSAAGLTTVLLTFSLDYVRTRLASDVLRIAQPGVAVGERQVSVGVRSLVWMQG